MHLRSPRKLLMLLGATTTVMLLSSYERFNPVTIRGDVIPVTPIIVQPNSLLLDNNRQNRKEDSGYDGKNQRTPVREEEAGTVTPGNTQHAQITTKKSSHNEVKNPESWRNPTTVSDNKDINVQGSSEPTTHVLLLSSMGRSGSSFLGEILSSVPSAFYYFEPLYQLSHQLREDMVWRGLMGLFTCNMSTQFVHAAVDRQNVLSHNKKLAHCNASCLKSGGLVKECRNNKVKVIKSIRTQVAWVAPLLKALPSLKVIHLVRDPRGTILSMSSLGWLEKEYNITTGCYNFTQDLLNSKTLTALYPDRFLNEHTGDKNSRRPYDTHRHTSTMKEEWRAKITLEQLVLSEAICGGVITQLGYRLFNGSLKDTRNLSIPLFNNNVND
ncbi:hypothetical protein Pmani_013533 [Petrolisthes manimaculis]|uniref:Sulfotransferase n=1 Tax=Petrolisthes manimaculis TaxID=1843537 RepID=A0AAE1U9I5_9EUCA|nr:hypothetical protein Pmani_013533 [Petrolisthes manimaculis]